MAWLRELRQIEGVISASWEFYRQLLVTIQGHLQASGPGEQNELEGKPAGQ